MSEAELPAVLLVDDDPRNLLALETVLSDGEFTLVQAQTGDAALRALMEREFAAIVLDVQMPDVSGIELARLIKQRKRTRHLPILFLTAHFREDEHAVLGYDAGAVDYLTKPIHPTVLRSKVNVFVDLFQKTRALASLNAQLEAQNIVLQREAEERSRRIEAESARAEAEAANAAKDRFLAMLSHELRTPLTPIIYSIAMLEADPDCPPRLRESIDIIRRNVRLEARLIDDLLDLARIRSGKLALEVHPVDAHETLRDALQICRGEIVQRNVGLVEDLAADCTQLEADPARLQQIFWNLLRNAAKFTPEGGTITVRTENFEGRILIEIKDTGVGIEPQKIGQIFDAFEQVTRVGSGGLGLGLAICKTLAELHGGNIEAHSAGPGQGASFIVTLPCTTSARVEEIPPAAELSGSTALRILLVEDHKDTADVLRQLLTWQGYDVRIASSIADALEAATNFDFDLVISDIGLPDGRGTDLIVKLREQIGRPLRAIAMSGFGMEDDLECSRRAGFAEHLTKPVEFSALRQAILRVATATPATTESAANV